MVGVVASRLVDPVLTDVRVHVEGDVRLVEGCCRRSRPTCSPTAISWCSRGTPGTARRASSSTERAAARRCTWTSAVDFPDRERQNPFVARLWASQRVGYLSAEKRRDGGDAQEARRRDSMLGERYGIPTEFTSYLVTEPRFAMNHGCRCVAGGRGARARSTRAMTAADAAPVNAMPASARASRFEEAKTASAQRAASSLAVARFRVRRVAGWLRRRADIDAANRRTYVRAARRRLDRHHDSTPACR